MFVLHICKRKLIIIVIYMPNKLISSMLLLYYTKMFCLVGILII